MRKTIQFMMLAPAMAVLCLAGPPGGGGHSFSGGGHSSGSSHSSVVAHSSGSAHSGHGIGVYGYGGPPAVSGPAPIGASGSAPLNAVGSLRPVYGFNGLAAGRHGAGPGRRANRTPYGYYPGSFVMPFYGYDGYSEDGYYDNSYAPGPDYGAAAPDQQSPTVGEQALGEQIQQLTNEVQDLQYQQQGQFQAQNTQPVVETAPQGDAQNDVPLTIVLHSGQQLQVKNYAVTDGVFWDFSKHPAQKIPVTAIDVPASQKATEANGGDFPPISQ